MEIEEIKAQIHLLCLELVIQSLTLFASTHCDIEDIKRANKAQLIQVWEALKQEKKERVKLLSFFTNDELGFFHLSIATPSEDIRFVLSLLFEHANEKPIFHSYQEANNFLNQILRNEIESLKQTGKVVPIYMKDNSQLLHVIQLAKRFKH